MNEDPIVAEVRQIRERRAQRFGYDIHKIFADIMAREADSSHPTVLDVEKWAEDIAQRQTLSVREESPRKN
jgi:hypothetical protein